MRPGIDLLNLLAVATVLLLSLAGAAWMSDPPPPPATAPLDADQLPIELLDGERVVRDAGGHPVPLRDYRRIASVSIISDDILSAICEPERLVAACSWSSGPWTSRLGGLPRLKGLDSLEAVLALDPDLVLVSGSKGSSEAIARLREAGISVFALGSARGLASFRYDARVIGHLVGHPQAGHDLASGLVRRLARVAAGLDPQQPRPRAIYLASYGGQLFGGTRGSDPLASSSYHDVLVAAGLVDVAAGRFSSAWPQLSAEQVLALEPELIVTREGIGDALRRLPGLSQLPAARQPGGIVELPHWMLEHPGRPMLPAAEALHAAVFEAEP